jgi:hypothetical protein
MEKLVSNDTSDEGSAANRSFEGAPDEIINEVYKQDMILCSRCSSLLSYRSMIIEEQENCGVFSRL